MNEPFGNPEQVASQEQRARERLPALARTHEGQKLYSLAYARGRLKGRQDATVDLGVIGTADQPALGDHQDKALAWDAVCMALNTYAPGWANSEEKTGLQSAVAAIAALANRQEVSTYSADYVLPCDVRVHPATTVTKGCTLRTLMQAITLREGACALCGLPKHGTGESCPDPASFSLVEALTQPAGDVGGGGGNG